ncbi:hypothetical protein GCM10010965_22370 [Caldalkalibacillus thermarum]|nr:hypothetical protein GCM10010965_22370 [Caldalkalibacillus thermarum]
MPASTETYLRHAPVSDFTILGGPQAVSDEVAVKIRETITFKYPDIGRYCKAMEWHI